jgi:MFS family permease
MITSMLSQPLFARLSDLVGRRLPYMAASMSFLAGIFLGSFAPSWEFLIFARAFCGMGFAGLMTLGNM